MFFLLLNFIFSIRIGNEYIFDYSKIYNYNFDNKINTIQTFYNKIARKLKRNDKHRDIYLAARKILNALNQYYFSFTNSVYHEHQNTFLKNLENCINEYNKFVLEKIN